MSSIYRSEEMALCQIFFQLDVAFACVSELGDLGIVQFQELNANLNAHQRKYVNEVRRCDDMERKMRLLEREVKLVGLEQRTASKYVEIPTLKEINYIETKLDLVEEEVRVMHNTMKSMKLNLMELVELKYVLRHSQTFFEEAAMGDAENGAPGNEDANLLERGDLLTKREIRERAELASIKLGFITGVIRRDKIAAFELLLWRFGHSNIFLRSYEINEHILDPNTGTDVQKVVFLIFCQGEKLKVRAKKICEGFRATLYPCPEDSFERREQTTRVANTIQDLKLIIGRTEEHVQRMLAASAKALPKWNIQIRKVKAVYHTMNKFAYDLTTNCLVAECWIPKIDITTVVYALKKATEISGSNIPPILNRMKTNEDPPTFNRVNKFTRGFQALVDAYGVASYREVNPATFSIITFPFLFAIMFGDAGHGVIMTAFSIALICMENKMKIKPGDELAKIFFGGRYIILLMGLFSIYTGMIYNDVFSRAINIFGSSWKIDFNHSTVFNNVKSLQLDPADPDVYKVPYSFGVDPAWPLAENKINFLNSFKMKLSIIFGVLHMIFGVIVSQRNYRYFKKRISIYCEFVPQLMFLVCIFGYLAFLMVYKWIFFGPQNEVKRGTYCAPSILIRFIGMVLMKKEKPLPGCEEDMFIFQEQIQYVLLGVAVVCIPWMLFSKPLAIMTRHRRKIRKLINDSYERSKQSLLSSKILREKRVIEEEEEEETEEVHEPDEDLPHDDFPHGPRSVSPQLSIYSRIEQQDRISDNSSNEDDYDEENEDSAVPEMFIHQAIHTIEYVLGSVSHTASYLRLWALSLAHQQLSEVLWVMVMGKVLKLFEHPVGWGIINGILVAIGFAFWATLTVGVLVMMEGLSAFLHTLRLHWVEFQSKFYNGLGHRFSPFSFAVILESLEAERAELGLG